jgi:hypothetical protein
MSSFASPTEKGQTTQVSVASAATASGSTNTQSSESNYRLPSDQTLKHATKLAIVEDKPIMMDYWTFSLEKKALIGVKETGEKILVKDEYEYTSTIVKFYKSVEDFIIITENSIYLVSSTIPTRKIS